ncbi:unnamed protein product [Dibothriocephalus latus]|uniref:Uncharacterized protein n=1 Tax=Dibothriocephalus latus TaxID=60516 RepID=A0A3P7LMY2_DIBLA|nr:unnamed protein product [Dibothriocephalus latus]
MGSLAKSWARCDFVGHLVCEDTVRLDTPIKRPYATEFVADWVITVVIQYLHRAIIIFATDENIKEGQLIVLSLLLRKLNVREDSVETGRIVASSERGFQLTMKTLDYNIE